MFVAAPRLEEAEQAHDQDHEGRGTGWKREQASWPCATTAGERHEEPDSHPEVQGAPKQRAREEPIGKTRTPAPRLAVNLDYTVRMAARTFAASSGGISEIWCALRA